MGLEDFVANAPVIGVVLALGVFLWRVFVRMLVSIEERLDRTDARMDSGFAKVDERLDKVDGRLDKVEARLGSLEHRADSVDGRLGTLEHKVDGLSDDHQSLARELSEFRGEMNGRLAAMLPAGGAAPA